jgi:hypothetical protein
MSIKSDCKKSRKKSVMIASVMGLTFTIITALLVVGLFITPSAILVVNYDSKDWNYTPTESIRVSSNYYADTSNATFTPVCLLIGYLYQRTESIMGKEKYIGQIIKQNIVSDTIQVNLDVFKTADDWFCGYTSRILGINESGSIEMRLSSDYQLMIVISVLVDFTDPNIPDTNLKFLYIRNSGVIDVYGLPQGDISLSLNRGSTLQIDIHNIQYNYTTVQPFWNIWTDEIEITPYPYLINASVSNEFNVMNYVKVR